MERLHGLVGIAHDGLYIITRPVFSKTLLVSRGDVYATTVFFFKRSCRGNSQELNHLSNGSVNWVNGIITELAICVEETVTACAMDMACALVEGLPCKKRSCNFTYIDTMKSTTV